MILIKNIFLRKFDSIIKIKVTGRNINNYIKKLIKAKINILDLKYISYKEAIIIVYYSDYLKLIEHKTIYEITVLDRLGRLKIKDKVKKNRILLLMIGLGLIFLFFLSNIIFDVEVIHSKSSIRNLILDELKEYGISKYKFKKSYDELEKIEDQILENNKDSLEWIEILESGTKYTVRVQERVINNEIKESDYQDIIATKNAVLTKIIAIQGEKIQKINNYVHKGDIVISGSLNHSDGSISYLAAEGFVYGEVWYTVDIECPYAYYEEISTGKKQNTYILKILNHSFTLFNNPKYKNYHSTDTILLFNNFLPITLIKQEREEIKVIEAIYTEDEALNKAISLAKDRLLDSNLSIEEVKQVKILDEYDTANNTIKLKLFISVIEDITGTKDIDIVNNNEKN